MLRVFKNTNQRGVSLIELLVGGMISAVVVLGGISFISSNQKTQMRLGLKNQASSEIQEFFANRKKSIAKVAPSLSASAVKVDKPSGGLPAMVTIPRTSFDANLNPTISNEVIEVACIDLPSGITSAMLPASFGCASVCNGNQVPIKVSIKQGGSATAGQVYPTNTNGTFPSGAAGSNFAVSLCPQKNGSLLSLRLTYLVRATTDQNFESVSRTEVFELPVDNGVPKPRVIGSSP